jgi:hypothetical protein
MSLLQKINSQVSMQITTTKKYNIKDLDLFRVEDLHYNHYDYNISYPQVMFVNDGNHLPKNFILERYFNDIYKMFLTQLTRLATGEKITKSEHKKLTKLLDEIVKVKEMLEKDRCN